MIARLFSILTALLALAQVAHAEVLRFDADAFQAKLRAGESVVVAAHAPWCPTCRAQQPIIEQLSGQPPYDELTIYTINYDKQKQVLRQLKISRQSTLVAYKSGVEVNRSIGATSPAAIESILKSAQ